MATSVPGSQEYDVLAIQALAEIRASLSVWAQQGFVQYGWEVSWSADDGCWRASFTTSHGSVYDLTQSEFEKYEAGWVAGRDFATGRKK
jgi:hypothetical protein